MNLTPTKAFAIALIVPGLPAALMGHVIMGWLTCLAFIVALSISNHPALLIIYMAQLIAAPLIARSLLRART